MRGDRAINEAQAEVIKRVFRDYAAGKSAKRIAVELNEDRIAAPGGRIQIEELHEALQEDSEAKRMIAANTIRSLMKAIILTPANGKVEIDVQGDLAVILMISAQTNPALLN